MIMKAAFCGVRRRSFTGSRMGSLAMVFLLMLITTLHGRVRAVDLRCPDQGPRSTAVSTGKVSLLLRDLFEKTPGFEDEVEQSFGRPCRQYDGRSKRTNDLTSSALAKT